MGVASDLNPQLCLHIGLQLASALRRTEAMSFSDSTKNVGGTCILDTVVFCFINVFAKHSQPLFAGL